MVVAVDPAGAQQYPPEPCIVTVSDSTVEPGQTIDITAGTFSPGTEITVTMTSAVLGTATVGESGTAVLSAVVPAGVSAGEHTIAVNGVGCAAVTVSITAGPATTAAPAEAAPRPSPSGALPRTGGDTFPVARVGGALVAFGAGLVLLARQRRRRTSPPAA